MAVQGQRKGLLTPRLTVSSLGVAAVIVAGLSLAAALLALDGSGAGPTPAPTAAEEVIARDERIAFFEARVAADHLDFIGLTVLAREYLQRARELGDSGDYARADVASARALELAPEYHASVVVRASLKLAQHDFQAALSLANEAVSLRPTRVEGYGIRADALLALGRYDEAGRDCERMVSLEPDFAALSCLAHLAFLTGDLVNARSFWQQALERSPRLPAESRAWALVQLAELHFGTGDPEGAGRELAAALRAYPDYGPALAALGLVRFAEGKREEALAILERAQERLPSLRVAIALGDLYAVSGRSADAARQYGLVGAIDQLYRAGGVMTDLEMSLYLSDHGLDPERALAMAESAYGAAPGVYAADALAWALFRNGRYQEAAARAAEALRLGTPDARFHFHAGMIHLALGNQVAAAALLSRALQINPHFSALHRANAEQSLAAARSALRSQGP